jgi:PIN domain nuclease of toxin-antitoxin system
MILLLDTHTLIWTLENNPTLSHMARDTIINGENMIFVSSVSAWEICIKKSMGKLETPDNLYEEIRLHRFTELKINFEHARLAGKLPAIQRDPFDRMLISQAMIEKLTLITRDKQIAQYDVNCLTA